MKLKIHWLEETLHYDGRQLRSHFPFDQTGTLGNLCVGFIGKAQVPLQNMVDLEDVRRREAIFSPRMLHFILEDFQLNLPGGVLLQRLMVVLVAEELQSRGIRNLERRGDDLYWKGKKLNVSIATRSPVSTLIHLGVNIQTEGAPVPAVGLQDWDLSPEEVGQSFLRRLEKEYGEILEAICKVKPVE